MASRQLLVVVSMCCLNNISPYCDGDQLQLWVDATSFDGKLCRDKASDRYNTVVCQTPTQTGPFWTSYNLGRGIIPPSLNFNNI